jgi:hypothetical protein
MKLTYVEETRNNLTTGLKYKVKQYFLSYHVIDNIGNIQVLPIGFFKK